MKGLTLGLAIVLLTGVAAVGAGEQEGKDADSPVSRAYPVADLVLTPEQRAIWEAPPRVVPVEELHLTPEQRAKLEAELGPMPKEGVAVRRAEDRPDMKPLIDLLTSTVAPGTWVEAGEAEAGEDRIGTMVPFYLNSSLIIRHSPDVHEQIVLRLRQLRRLPTLQGSADEF